MTVAATEDVLSELIEKLEGASEGSTELSWEIATRVVGLTSHEYPLWMRTDSFDGKDGAICPTPPYTTSIDAALSLVPEGCWWNAGCEDDFTPVASVFGPGIHLHEFGATPALALCIAALRALSSR